MWGLLTNQTMQQGERLPHLKSQSQNLSVHQAGGTYLSLCHLKYALYSGSLYLGFRSGASQGRAWIMLAV